MAANSMDTIMLLGDSLTQGGLEAGGFSQRLLHDYMRKLDVINRGLGGYNSRWGLTVLKQCFAKTVDQHLYPKVKLFVIWWGANDATLPGELQHIPLPEFKEYIKQTVALVKSPASEYYSPKTRVILMTPPPINPSQFDPANPTTRTPEVTKSYAEGVIEVGAEIGVPVVNLWEAVWKEAGEKFEGLSRLLSDGLHLTAEGYKVVYDALIGTVSKHYPELHYEALPSVYPIWDTVDGTNPDPQLVPHRIDV